MPHRRTPTRSQSWREFEQLVARIEQAAAGATANVTSPDRVRSLITGRKREVDATIRTRVGTADVLITIECRKRKASQDVTWLEQLGSKKQAVGAWRTIAVASSAFSSDAITAAAFYGIELRILSQITDADIQGLLLPRSVVHVFKSVDLYESPQIEFDAEPDDDFSGPEGVGANLTTADVNARVFLTASGEAISFNDLWLRADDQHKIFEAVPRDDKPHRCVVNATSADNLLLKTSLGPRRVCSVRMSLLLRWKHEYVPLEAAKVVAYAKAGTAARHIRAEFESKEAQSANVRFGFQFEEGSGHVTLSMELTPGAKSGDG